MAKNPNQIFEEGDLVQIAKDLGPHMSHFTNDKRAIVLYSYDDKYGGREVETIPTYGIYIEGQGETAWYYQTQLTLIEKNQKDRLDEWKTQRERERQQYSDLDWIFSEPRNYIIEGMRSASVQRLATEMGFGSLWGARGEGYDYYVNAQVVMRLCHPFLTAKDKEGFLSFAQGCKSANKEEFLRAHIEKHYGKSKEAAPG